MNQAQERPEPDPTSILPVPQGFPGGLREAQETLATVLEIRASVRNERAKAQEHPPVSRYLHPVS